MVFIFFLALLYLVVGVIYCAGLFSAIGIWKMLRRHFMTGWDLLAPMLLAIPVCANHLACNQYSFEQWAFGIALRGFAVGWIYLLLIRPLAIAILSSPYLRGVDHRVPPDPQ